VQDISGSDNTAVGAAALYQLGINGTGGTNDIALGTLAGYNFTGNESNNIDIGNEGVTGENNTIRIGSGQTSTYIAGVITNTGTMTLQAGADMDLAAANNLKVTVGADMQLKSGTTMTIQSGSGLTLSGTQLALTGGNVGIGNNSPGNLLVVGTGGAYCNGTTWVNGSDRNSKEDFAAIKPADVLAKVAALPITEWKYKVEADGTEHLGPMAQDFHAAFGLNGADDKHIATVDEEGVALAAIQGLDEKVDVGSQQSEVKIQKLEAENTKLKQQNDSLAERLNELETTVKQLAANK